MRNDFAPVGSPRAQRVFAIAFVVLLALPLLGQLAGWNNEVALLERHEPSPFPALPHTRTALQAWPQDVDRWLVDRAGFRSALVLAGSAIEVYLFGHSTNRDVVPGRDGWLFYAGDRTLEQMNGTDVFTQAALDRWIDRFEARRDWLARRGIPFLVVIVPNKERVYHEFLPASAGALAPVTRLTQIRERLTQRGSSLQLLDLTDALLAAKAHTQVYARRDTHWSGAGAFRGYLAIMHALQPALPTLQPLRPEQMDEIDVPYPARELDLLRMLGLGWAGAGETLPYPLPRPTTAWTSRREDSTVDGVARTRLVTTRTDAPNIVWFHDSFSDTLAVYLNATFGTTVLESHGSTRFDKALIDAERPDAVVYELVERFLPVEPAAD